MKIIGLDLSLRATGVCILSGALGSDPGFRTLLLPQPKVDTVEGRTRRLISITEAVLDIVRDEKPDVVIIEAPAVSQPYQAHAMGEIHGVVKVQLLLAFGMTPKVKQANAMRKAVVGKIGKTMEKYLDRRGKERKRWSYGKVPGKRGKMRRATVKDVVERRLCERGLEFPNQDEMDAYVVARYGWDQTTIAPGAIDEEEHKEDKRAQ